MSLKLKFMCNFRNDNFNKIMARVAFVVKAGKNACASPKHPLVLWKYFYRANKFEWRLYQINLIAKKFLFWR